MKRIERRSSATPKVMLVLLVCLGGAAWLAAMQRTRYQATKELTNAICYVPDLSDARFLAKVADALERGADPNAHVVLTNRVASPRDVFNWVRHDQAIFWYDEPLLTEVFIQGPVQDAALLELLLRYGANPNRTDSWGRTSLMRGAEFDALRGSSVGTRALLKHGADPFLRDSDGNTAYAYAVQAGGPKCEVARLLAKHTHR